jgi:hypothetical protein
VRPRLAAALVILALAAPALRAPAAGAATPCAGVTVVVDFGPWGGNIEKGCANSPSTGLDALNQAGFRTTPTRQFGAAYVCRIDDLPGPADQACIVTPPANAYWAYYWARPGDASWHYADTGATGRTPPAGTIDAWAFGNNARPRISPTAFPRPAPPATQPPNPAASTPIAGSTGGTAAGHPATSPTLPKIGDAVSATAGGGGVVRNETTSTTTKTAAAETKAAAAVKQKNGKNKHTTTTTNPDSARIVDRTASSSKPPSSNSGSPVPAIIAVVLIAAATTGGILFARSRRQRAS